MGITVDEPAYVFGDNQLLLASTTAPGSTLKKKSNAIANHFVQEGCARDEWQMTYINMDENVADLLTKALAGPKQTKFVCMLLHHYTCSKFVIYLTPGRVSFPMSSPFFFIYLCLHKKI